MFEEGCSHGKEFRFLFAFSTYQATAASYIAIAFALLWHLAELALMLLTNSKGSGSCAVCSFVAFGFGGATKDRAKDPGKDRTKRTIKATRPALDWQPSHTQDTRHMFLFLSPFPFPPITRTLLYKFKLHAPPDGGIGYPGWYRYRYRTRIRPPLTSRPHSPPPHSPRPSVPCACPVSVGATRDARRATINPHAPRRTPPHATDC
jgi:hypothetical protein